MTSDARRKARGLTLLELAIVVLILGVLAAVAVPYVSQGTQQARQAALADNLREVRLAIARYMAEHGGVPPGYPDGDVTKAPTEKALRAQLTQQTYPSGEAVTWLRQRQYGSRGFNGFVLAVGGSLLLGQLGPSGLGAEAPAEETGSTRGPYLREFPENPLNGSDKVYIVTSMAAMESAEGDADYGWIYRPCDASFASAVKCDDVQ
ncbi:MAG: type II secretion system protein [Planctomycetes bacterium]|nr:type II secretion system protein [Planctomycetota bacterium]